MVEEFRRFEVWQDEFEKEYNVKFGHLKVDLERYCMVFPTEQDYTMFMLRWA